MSSATIPEFSDLTSDEIAHFVPKLVEEVDTALRSDKWVLVPQGLGGVRLHSGAALWHACELLQDLVAMLDVDREMAIRIVSRALLEACLIAFYLHFGGIEALQALESDMKGTLVAQQHDADQYDAELRAEIKRIRKRNKQVRKDNKVRTAWNNTRPVGTDPLPITEEELEPTRPAINGASEMSGVQ